MSLQASVAATDPPADPPTAGVDSCARAIDPDRKMTDAPAARGSVPTPAASPWTTVRRVALRHSKDIVLLLSFQRSPFDADRVRPRHYQAEFTNATKGLV
jgi:hypothetical protein